MSDKNPRAPFTYLPREQAEQWHNGHRVGYYQIRGKFDPESAIETELDQFSWGEGSPDKRPVETAARISRNRQKWVGYLPTIEILGDDRFLITEDGASPLEWRIVYLTDVHGTSPFRSVEESENPKIQEWADIMERRADNPNYPGVRRSNRSDRPIFSEPYQSCHALDCDPEIAEFQMLRAGLIEIRDATPAVAERYWDWLEFNQRPLPGEN